MTTFFLLHLLALTLLLLTTTPSTTAQSGPPPPSFKCTTNTTCKALIGYISPNTTTLSHIQSLFQVKTLRQLLGVNNLPLNTPPNYTVIGNKTVIKIPFPCHCENNTGLSNHTPLYTVVTNDYLYHIANDIFKGFVTASQIQTVNNIPNPNLIYPGQKLWIPLPCSCDDVEGEKVVHYGHVVASKSSLTEIANEFGTSSETLMSLNGISDPKKLFAGQVLDVPLKACSSSVNSSSPDSPLLVANGTYIFTANNCITCKCDPTNNFTLQCQPSGLKSVNWPTCPTNLQCPGSSLLLGNSTTSSCSRTTCAYAGYNKQTVLTTLDVENTCPAPSGDSNRAARSQRRGWSLAVVLCLQLIMLQRFM